MAQSRLVSIIILMLIVVAFTLVAPSVEHPTRTHGGEKFTGSKDTSTMKYGEEPGDHQRNMSKSQSSGENNSSSQSNGSHSPGDKGVIDGLLSFAAVVGALIVAL